VITMPAIQENTVGTVSSVVTNFSPTVRSRLRRWPTDREIPAAADAGDGADAKQANST
jgi:hypothetical protein